MTKPDLISKQQSKILQLDHVKSDQTVTSLSQIKSNIKDNIHTLRSKMRSIKPDGIDIILSDLCNYLIEIDKIMELGKSEELIMKEKVRSLDALKSYLGIACTELTKAADWQPAKVAGIENRENAPLDIYYKYLTDSIENLEKSLKEGLY